MLSCKAQTTPVSFQTFSLSERELSTSDSQCWSGLGSLLGLHQFAIGSTALEVVDVVMANSKNLGALDFWFGRAGVGQWNVCPFAALIEYATLTTLP